MHNYPLFVLTAMALTACGGGDESSNSRSKEPKWLIAIEGLPEKSGSIVVAVAAGNNGRYTLGRSGFTASIGVFEGEPASDMMFNFDNENIRCFQTGDATLGSVAGRAMLSGVVECMAMSGAVDRPRTTAVIEGWFELKE